MNGIGVLKELYDSEINFSISCDSDGGFDVVSKRDVEDN